MSLLKLFFIFVKIGAILLGGGYVILPIMSSEFVEKRNLISHDELVDYFAISQSLPGIIAANISIFVGYKLKGKFGAIVAMLGIIFVPFWSIVLLASLISSILDNQILQGALWGVEIAVIALIIVTIREMWQKSNKNKFFYFIFLTSAISIIVFKFSPIQTILLSSTIGIIIKKFFLKTNNKEIE